MATYRIPEYVKEGFSIIIKSPPKKFDTLINVLNKVPKRLLPSELSDYLLKKKIYSEKQSSKIVDVLASLYRLKESETKSINEIVENICQALRETNDVNLKPRPNFEKSLTSLLSLKTIGASFKALGLLTDYEKTFVDSRIILDIRPVFDDNLDNKIETGVIVHNLRIEYHKGKDTHEEIFLALDSNDLNKLKEQILRALKKEKSIKLNLKDNFNFIETINN